MKKIIFFVIGMLIFAARYSDAAVKLKIIVNTNRLVSCERGYIQIQALNSDNSIDTSWNGMVEVQSSNPLITFINEQEERDYDGKIEFPLTNGQNQMGDATGKRGIGFWDCEPQTITLTASDIDGKLTSDSTNLSIIDFNSPHKVLFSEIMFKTYNNNKKYKWIELYNNSDTDIPLNNFKLQRYSYKTYYGSGSTYEYTLTTTKSIKARSFAIICHGIGNLNTFFPDITTNGNYPIIGDSSLSFDLVSDNPLFLLDSTGKYCDGLIYEASWGNDSIYNISMERKDYNVKAYLKDNWGECVNLEYWNYGAKGTPGKENSITKKSSDAELKISVSLNKKVFSPKENEFLEITYSLSEYATVTIKVFNSSGSEIIEILKHQSSGTEERTVRFYGKDRDNKTLTAGIYIIYIEALNSETGKTATKAVSFVIGNKM